jgi:ATP-dependent Clp protease ATP-binding subunit ClpC
MLDLAAESRVICAVSDDAPRLEQLRAHLTASCDLRKRSLLVFERNRGLFEFERGRKQWRPMARPVSGPFPPVASGEVRSEAEALVHVDGLIRQTAAVFVYPYADLDSDDPRSLAVFLRQWAAEARLFLDGSMVLLFCRTEALIAQQGLARDVAVFHVPASSDAERLGWVRYLTDLYGIPINEAKEEELAAALKGLGILDVQRALYKAYDLDGKAFDLKRVSQASVEYLKRGAILQKVEPKPLVGRERELRELCDILAKRDKANAILVGAAGVGKTAVVEGLAWLIDTRRVPRRLLGTAIVSVSLADLTADTRLRGEFEGRLKRVVDEVRRSDGRLILFIDEIHTVAQAEGGHGAIAAADILKPILTSGVVRLIGATTPEEFVKLEKDRAFARRFAKVTIEEPTEDEALLILAARKPSYEQCHGVPVSDEALQAAVRLSRRYITDLHLPDKALDLIDRACVRAASRNGEAGDHQVSAEDVARVVAERTGIPVARLTASETGRLLRMEEVLAEIVVGQGEALATVAQAIRRARAGLGDPQRPAGVFLFVGPTGVGKTELAHALAEFLFGDRDRMVRLDMSEFHDRHTVSRLIGSPPGYIDSEKRGQLTEPVRRRPYSVVLLDEIEKAHQDVWSVFLQVFDEGRLTDGLGWTVDFCNTVIIMTSNLGGEDMSAAGSEEEGRQALEAALRGTFKAEFLNRIDDVVVFRALDAEDMHKILSLYFRALNERLEEKSLGLTLEPEVKALIIKEGFSTEFGARELKRAFQRLVVNPLSNRILRGAFKAGDALAATLHEQQITFEVRPCSESSC